MGLCAYLAGAGGSLDIKKFLGGVTTLGNTVYKVPDNPFDISNGGAHSTMMALYQWMLDVAPNVSPANPAIIPAHSRGTQVCLKLMREKGAALISQGVDPNAYKFYLAGCPEAPYTGSSVLWPTLDVPIYPGVGTKCGKGGGSHDSTCPTPLPNHGGFTVGYGPPNPCPWKIWFIINEWDGWAHAPAGYASEPSFGRPRFLGIPQGQPFFEPGNLINRMRFNGSHASGKYNRNPFDAAVPKATFSELNFTYIYLQIYPMPIAKEFDSIRVWAKQKDAKYRPLWKAAYTNMPSGVVVPAPNYAELPSWIPFDG